MKAGDIRSTYCENPNGARPLKAEYAILYDAREHPWHFCHHPELGVFQGRLYAMWSNGPTGEDEYGQRILLSRSEDGARWTEPRALCENMRGRDHPSTLTAAGFFSRGDSLAAYFAAYEFASEGVRGSNPVTQVKGRDMCRTRLYAATTRDGERFTPPIDLRVPVCPNIGPTATSSGRLIITGNWAHAYCDEPSGTRPGSWRMTGFCRDVSALPQPLEDNPGYFGKVSEIMGLPGRMCEGSFYQTDDGVIHMMHRSYTDYLYESRSLDDGTTWSVPQKTSFTDCRSKFHFGRLPDGRFYYIGNPVPGSNRSPLVLSLSRNGALFDRHYCIESAACQRKFAGYAKNGMYAYPHSVVYQESLYVIYSVWKEDIRVARIPLPQFK